MQILRGKGKYNFTKSSSHLIMDRGNGWRSSGSRLFLPIFWQGRGGWDLIERSYYTQPMGSISNTNGAFARSVLIKNEGLITPLAI